MNISIKLPWLLASLGILLVVGVAFFTPLNGIEGAGFDRFLGRFHPLILHFPVACLSLIALLEISRLSSKFKNLKQFIGPMLILAALSACVTVFFGLLLGSNEGHSGVLIDRHRSRGISVAILSCLAAALYYTATKSKSRMMWTSYFSTFVAAIVMMGLTAHVGGSLVHGPTYLADHAPSFLKPILTTHTDTKSQEKDAHITENVDENSTLSESLLARFDGEVGNFFNGYCSRCHGDSKQEANVRLDIFDETFQSHLAQHNWERVMGVLGAHRMPPKSAKQPSDKQRAAAMNWIYEALEEYAFSRRANQANAPLRRINRREINHSYQDLFNVDVDFVTRLPTDAKSEKGYDTDANLLLLSMSDLRLYQDIARDAVETYVHFGERKDTVDEYFVEMEDVYHFGRQAGQTQSYERAAQPLSVARLESIKRNRVGKTPTYRLRQYGPLPHGVIPNGVVEGVGEGRGFERLHEQFMLLRTDQTTGKVIVRVHAAMTPGKNGDMSVPRLRLEAGWRNLQSLRVKVIGEQDVTASKDNPQTIDFTFQLEEIIAPETARWNDTGDDRYILLVLSNYARHENGNLAGSIYGQIDMKHPESATEATPYLEQAATAAEQQKKGYALWEKGGVPYLYLDALEASITPAQTDPNAPWILSRPKSPTKTSGMSEAEVKSAIEPELVNLRDVLNDFLPKVFRRTVSAQDIKPFETLFTSMRLGGDSYENSVKEVLASALISPSFLYIGYPAPQMSTDDITNTAVSKNNYLASRLSYFLWSSLPDAELRDISARGELTDPAILSAQIDRMLEDPRSTRLTRTFARQWTQVDKVSNTSVSEELYPDYGPQFSDLIKEETLATFEDNFQNRRDARELFSSGHMMLNDQLARHYGVKGVKGGDIRRVATENSGQRAGLLTHASILTMNSNGQDSHPIKRGVWLLERVLNDPPPPPPPSVPDLDTNNPLLADLTLKQQIEHHRSLSACSGCHEKIDPWGVVFENFDATGRWRDTVDVKGKPVTIDASSVLADGTALEDVITLGDYLRTEKEGKLMQALVHHYMMYALGRELDVLDEAEAEAIYTSFRASGYKLAALTKFIIQSDAFTNRQHSTQSQIRKKTQYKSKKDKG